MLVAVVGGNLQGVEAAYLAKKAGWEVTVIDRKAVVPAAGLGDRFSQVNITSEKDLERALKGVDLVIPALENDDALAKKIAALCDVFINDAFATVHRTQASTYGVAKYAKEKGAGLLLYKGNMKDSNVNCLLAEAHPEYPDSRSAAEVLKILDKLVPMIEMDPEPLLKEAEEIEEKVKKSMAQIKPMPPAELSDSATGMYG